MTASLSRESASFDPMLSVSNGAPSGISPVGFRSAKTSPGEWHTHNYAKYNQSLVDRSNSEQMRNDSRRLIKETSALTDKNETESTKKLAERLHDVHFWKSELNREIKDVIAETDLLCQQKRRLENALLATEVPLYLANDNLECRQRRYGVDKVEDDVEHQLLTEVQLINNVQDLLKRTIQQTDKQIALNREAKQLLEMDWSDKKEASELDSFSGHLKREDTNKQFYPGSAKFDEKQSDPESWAQFSHNNIVRGEHERMASIQLRSLIDNILQDISRDMRAQADSCEVSLAKRIDELQDAKHKLEDNLCKTVSEIARQEQNIRELKEAIRAKEDPLKVAQTRLHTRKFRPGVELCRDPPQYALISEVGDISNSIEALKRNLEAAEESLKDLQDTRLALEHEIAMKKNSILIDKDKCLALRSRFPSVLKLQGYQ